MLIIKEAKWRVHFLRNPDFDFDSVWEVRAVTVAKIDTEGIGSYREWRFKTKAGAKRHWKDFMKANDINEENVTYE